LILTYRFNQSRKEILYEESHNAVPFILFTDDFLLMRNKTLRLSNSGIAYFSRGKCL